MKWILLVNDLASEYLEKETQAFPLNIQAQKYKRSETIKLILYWSSSVQLAKLSMASLETTDLIKTPKKKKRESQKDGQMDSTRMSSSVSAFTDT